MKHKTWIRAVSLVLLAVLILGLVPMGLASDQADSSSETPASNVEDSAVEKSTAPVSEDGVESSPEDAPDAASESPEESAETDEIADDVPRSMDGETLTRTATLNPSLPSGGPRKAMGIMAAAAASTGTITKSTCVNFSEYESPRWYCNRYTTKGTHVYGHYFYASSIAYHKIGGKYAYCIEPNTSSIAGATYSSYAGDSAASDSFWGLELDATQRDLIEKIMACGYPEIDYGYTEQQQYAATQTLIWEVCAKLRYSNGIQYSSDYGLFSKIYAVLGDGYQKTYDGIISNIVASNGKVPSFAGASSAKSVTLTYNSSTNCYEGSVTDSNAVLSYFTFSRSGVTFTKSGNTLKISVPASSASSVKGQTITGTSTLKDFSSCNPTVWENSTYQTVLTAGGASNLSAYISLTWTEPSTPTPTPTPTPEPDPDPGSLKIVKYTSDSSVSVSGWKFSIYIDSVGTTITRTTNASGVINVTSIPAGSKCTVTESTYSGYKVLSAQSCTVYEGQTSTLSFTNSPLKGNLTVTKSVNYGSKSGFQFRLYGTSTIGKAVDVTATTNSSGKATFSNINVGTYTLEEVDPGNAYIKPSSQTVTISANSTTGAAATATASMTNTWKYWSATVTKVDADSGKTGAAMAGAEYTLYQSGTKVKTYTVGSDGTFTTDSYPCTSSDSVYTLKETKAPEGYQLDGTTYKLSTGYANFSKATNSITLTVSDQPIKGKIQIQKYAVNTVSGAKQPENGATFEVYLKSAGSYAKASADQRDIVTIGADGKGTTKDLRYGTYCIKQKSGWEGYDLDTATYEASITTNGATVTKGTNNKNLVMENAIWKGTMTILKVDGDTNAPLSGAEFTLTGSDHSTQTATTGADGKVTFENLVYGVTYLWQETKAPKGYLLDENNKGTWNVAKHDDSITVTAGDKRRPGRITVTKQDMDGNALSGSTFLLEYKDGSTWRPITARTGDTVTKGGTTSAVSSGCLTTDASGSVTFEGLWADEAIQYRLTEVSAPEGYSLLTEPAYEGTLPVALEKSRATAEPEEVIGNTAYFYTLPVTVKDGQIYTLPQTGGSGVPMIPMALLMLALGTTVFLYAAKPTWFSRPVENHDTI